MNTMTLKVKCQCSYILNYIHNRPNNDKCLMMMINYKVHKYADHEWNCIILLILLINTLLWMHLYGFGCYRSPYVVAVKGGNVLYDDD